MDDHKGLIDRLEFGYRSLYNKGTPAWGYKGIAPAIPFVGEKYSESETKVLLYASAENLASNEKHRHELETRGLREQLLRSYGAKVLHHQDQNVHIEPINNGSLLKVARHILSHFDFGRCFSTTSSKEFLSQITVANPGKFSIDPETIGMRKKKNLDYADSPEKFNDQRDYIGVDLQVLDPTLVIIPITILSTFREARMDSLLDSAETIVAIKQVQFQAIFGKGKRRQLSKPKSEWNSMAGYGEWKAPFYADAYVQWIDENKEKTKWNQRVIHL